MEFPPPKKKKLTDSHQWRLVVSGLLLSLHINLVCPTSITASLSSEFQKLCRTQTSQIFSKWEQVLRYAHKAATHTHFSSEQGLVKSPSQSGRSCDAVCWEQQCFPPPVTWSPPTTGHWREGMGGGAWPENISFLLIVKSIERKNSEKNSELCLGWYIKVDTFLEGPHLKYICKVIILPCYSIRGNKSKNKCFGC